MALKRYNVPDFDDNIGGFRTGRGSGAGGPFTRSTGSGVKIATLTMIAEGKMLHLECGYNKDFIDSLRQSIPSTKRYYDNGDKTWYLVADQYEKVAFLLEKYFDDTILVDFPTQLAGSDSWTMLHLLEGAPLEVVNAAYKALAKLHHPDRGGDPNIMTQINVAYKDILGVLAEAEAESESKPESAYNF